MGGGEGSAGARRWNGSGLNFMAARMPRRSIRIAAMDSWQVFCVRPFGRRSDFLIFFCTRPSTFTLAGGRRQPLDNRQSFRQTTHEN
jgi:hypothetical protein